MASRCIFFAFFEIGVLGPFQIALFGTYFLHFSKMVVGVASQIPLFGTFFAFFGNDVSGGLPSCIIWSIFLNGFCNVGGLEP